MELHVRCGESECAIDIEGNASPEGVTDFLLGMMRVAMSGDIQRETSLSSHFTCESDELDNDEAE